MIHQLKLKSEFAQESVKAWGKVMDLEWGMAKAMVTAMVLALAMKR
jgi:hypothetical protein